MLGMWSLLRSVSVSSTRAKGVVIEQRCENSFAGSPFAGSRVELNVALVSEAFFSSGFSWKEGVFMKGRGPGEDLGPWEKLWGKVETSTTRVYPSPCRRARKAGRAEMADN